MTWKLVERTPSERQIDIAAGADYACINRADAWSRLAAAHDAAPSEPTDAVMELVRAAQWRADNCLECGGNGQRVVQYTGGVSTTEQIWETCRFCKAERDALSRVRTECPGLVEDALQDRARSSTG